MKRKILLLSFITFFSVLEAAHAQQFTKRHRYTTFGLTATAANYLGDLTPGPSILSTDPELTRYNIGVYAMRKFYPRLSGQVRLSWARLRGDDAESTKPMETQDAGRWQRNLNFRNDIKELAVLGIYDLVATRKGHQDRKDLTPYIYGGVAVFHHNPKTYYNGGRMEEGFYELQPLQTEGVKYSKVQFSLPFGFGFRYRLGRELDLAFDIGWRRTFTDYLDDVSTVYADKNELATRGEAAWILSDRSLDHPALQGGSYLIDGKPYTGGTSEPGMQRGDRTRNDWYILTGFTLSYSIAPKSKTPKFR